MNNAAPDQPQTFWYVVHTKPNHERLCEDALRRKGFEAYLPSLTKHMTHGGKRHVVARPLFLRYLFVGLSSERPQFHEVRKTHGVEWLVSNLDNPVRIDAGIVEAIRRGEQAGVYDETAPKPKATLDLKAGDKVEMVEGPFANLPAKIMAAPSEQRIQVVMQLFGRKTRITTNLANLRRVG